MCACSVVSAKHDFIEITYQSYSLSSPLSFPSFLPPLPQRSLGTGVRSGFNLFLNYSSHPPQEESKLLYQLCIPRQKYPFDFADFPGRVSVINKVCDDTHLSS